jgi:hypothetical protein
MYISMCAKAEHKSSPLKGAFVKKNIELLKMIRRLKGSSRDYRITSKSICLCRKEYFLRRKYSYIISDMRSNLASQWRASYIVELLNRVYDA